MFMLLLFYYFCSNSLCIKFRCGIEAVNLFEFPRAIKCDCLFGVGSNAFESLLAKITTNFDYSAYYLLFNCQASSRLRHHQ